MVLVEGYAADKSDESAMVLGCSDLIALVPNANQASVVQPSNNRAIEAAGPPDIQNLTTSFMSPSSLFVAVHLSSVRPDAAGAGKCTITVSVYTMGRPVAHHRLNCTAPWVTVTELPAERSYQVCASIGSKFPKDDEATMVCTSVDGNVNGNGGVGWPVDWFTETLGAKSYAFLLSATFTAFVFLSVLLAYRACKKSASVVGGRRATARVQTHQCFLPVPPTENGTQRPRYVKLQATTVL